MPHEVLTSEEFRAALERLYERLMRIGWIEQTGSHEDIDCFKIKGTSQAVA
jgi:hypothetical protein